ncbi:transcriptional regulator [Acinetobacter baumannii]|uniref:transcriptional regulator n=1 Tax=Acinetobacter baumannii TaxID=470 RepID=UPI003ED964BD
MVEKNNVATLREQAGMTVYQLAKQCGFISNNHVLNRYIKDAEAGKHISVYRALLIYTELNKAGVCEKFEDVFWLECDDKDIEN